MNDELIKWLFGKIMEQAKEANDLEENDFNSGMKLAYRCVLDMLETQLNIYDINPEEYGINNIFDKEK